MQMRKHRFQTRRCIHAYAFTQMQTYIVQTRLCKHIYYRHIDQRYAVACTQIINIPYYKCTYADYNHTNANIRITRRCRQPLHRQMHPRRLQTLQTCRCTYTYFRLADAFTQTNSRRCKHIYYRHAYAKIYITDTPIRDMQLHANRL